MLALRLFIPILLHVTVSVSLCTLQAFEYYASIYGLTVTTHDVIPAASLAFPPVQFYNYSDSDGERVRESWRAAIRLMQTSNIRVTTAL